MARNIDYTLILEGELVAETPLHIGGADNADTIDMPLAVNGKGEYYLPGTSIAGAIKAWEQGANDSWGYAEKSEGHASFIIVDDAPALGDNPVAELWHGVGIDRRYGGAFEGVKFDRQVLPQGTRFNFRLQREVPAGVKPHLARIEMQYLKVALENGDILFGGSVTRGFGRLTLKNAQAREIEWGSRDGIFEWLKNPNGKDTADEWSSALANAEHIEKPIAPIRIEIHWQPRGPLMSKSAQDGISADMLPFITRNYKGEMALALPGSGIKGALRQHAERIVRTVCDLELKNEQHFDQVDVPLVTKLFGATRSKDEKVNGKSQATGGARALLAVDTCYSKFSLEQTEWDARDAGSANWTERSLYKADHVAIDRWTGGASDGALFNTVEPDKSIKWEPIHLTLNCRRGKPLPELALLWLTLRDLCAGRIPLGFGVNRGFGDLTVNKIMLQGLEALNCGLEIAELTVSEGAIEVTAIANLMDELKKEWTGWIKSNDRGGK